MKKFILLSISILLFVSANAQIVINEGSCRNFTQVADAFGDNPDWLELYNAGNATVNLWHYHLSDDRTNLSKWSMPEIELHAKQWILIYASGKGQSDQGVNHWETAVREEDTWNWINPVESTPATWMTPGFDDHFWNKGQGGFGYGDGDDFTQIPMSAIAVYTRINFNIKDISKIVNAVLHMDYDDGFVAYLNGTEIARANVQQTNWNSTATASHEALLFQAKRPESFNIDIDLLNRLLRNGENTLAVEGHNFTAGLIDMSLRTFLSFGLADSGTQFGPLPGWFETESKTDLHSNFKISGCGETIYLSDRQGSIIDSLAIPGGLPVNSSVGCETDGSAERGVFLIATPGESNDGQMAYTEGFEPVPVISLPGGFYQEAIEVTISCSDPSAEIRFTRNGQIPSIHSDLYTGSAITISTNTVLKARSFSTGHKLAGQAASSTYFISQTPTPAGILSITMENSDLYGPTGIYDNWWTDWKKQCYIEYFDPGTHLPVIRQFSGIKIDGGAGGSRSLPQHSFRIEPGNSALGDGDIVYPLIPSRSDRSGYETFYIRNGSNQSLYYPCKDAIETRSMGEGTLNTYAGYTPVQVYLNGEYWGYYELREKLDKDYFDQHMGTDEDSINIVSVSYWYGDTLRAVTGGDPVTRFREDYNSFINLNSHSDNFWDMADRFIDLEYYTDYICAQTFMANTDWPYNNIRIYQSPQTGNRWRFSLIDLEWSLAPNGWSDSNMDHIRFMLDYDRNNLYIHLWQKAMENKRYHDYFINRLADLLNSNWKSDKLRAIANDIYKVTRPELPATFKRWGDPNISTEAYMTQFDQAHLVMLNELTNRTTTLRNHVKSNFSLPKSVSINLDVEPVGSGTIRISTIKPDSYPWTGTYFDGVPVKIEAIANPGFVFTNWDVNALISSPLNAVFLDTLTRAATFRAHFKTALFSEKLIVSEINYNSESSVDAGDWIEIWNYDKVLSASLNGWYFTDSDSTHVFQFPENTIIRPDERLVVAGDPDKFRKQHPGVQFTGTFSFGLGGSGDAVSLYNFSRKLISGVVYDDESPWPAGADGQGRTLEIRSEYHPTNDPANWFDGCIGGSPGKAYSPCSEPIVFSEINFKSDSGLDHGDWVELRNTGESNTDLAGWVFKDEVDSLGHAFMIPPGTLLKPHTNMVLVQDSNKFRSIHPGLRNFKGPFQFGLKDKGEWIRAYDSYGKLRLSVRYNDVVPWPVLAGGAGYTLEVVDSSGIMNDGTNWMTGCIGGSPGRYYSSDCSGSATGELAMDSEISVFPNPTADKIFVRSSGLAIAGLTLKNLLGQTVMVKERSEGTSELSLRYLPAGAYILTVNVVDGSVETFRIVRQ